VTAHPARGRFGRSAKSLACHALLAALLSGCALVPAPPPAIARGADLPAQAELADVPFFADDRDECGPATLAAALGFAGAPRSVQQLADQVYLPQRQGALQPEMLAAVRRAGLVAYRLRPELRTLLAEVAGGLPVVVLQNLRLDAWPRWHYAVVVGYDLDRGELVLRSGTHERLTVSLAQFDRTWSKSGRWAFVAVPAGRMPATAAEDDYVAAAAALERTDAPAARAAYDLALARWPQDLVARIGLGNLAYGARDLPGAQAQYRQATREHPDSGDAWNNLAQVLLEQGEIAQARDCARKAVGLGGPRADDYRETLRAIEQHPGAP
jgi:hypothetical protein